MRKQIFGVFWAAAMMAPGITMNFVPKLAAAGIFAAAIALNAYILGNMTWQKHAMTDKLTGLRNRAALDQQLKVYRKRQVSVLMIDIDNFKSINDSFGHAIGDGVLYDVANTMMSQIRGADIYRYGGEEFTIILPGLQIRESYAIAERLRKAVEQHVHVYGRPVTISIGVASCSDIKLAMKQADECLYESKQRGRNATTACAC
ncbi:diguanylate cyclase (GGDEF) domain-containing protein [Paenibacillus sp. UNC496MF]|uniref:GGDEF domain-containing protein n=1 Tax=Paenibacillus sp. UNC496MF TaxID=1502753 RepID=UPI0008E24C4B|nr:GGDEF domain-containing protein [Paenibacillus sp. UNC496MF]SFJ63185.1 diguanylate cyclase (GGDEF) domain-containing protein [Paenibacillus sp. UNC496MF]